jgi:hypothetical protein
MMRSFAALVACSLLSYAVARADTVEVALPTLLSSQAWDFTFGMRGATIQLSARPTAIRGAYFRIKGEWRMGQWYCEPGGTRPVAMDVYSYMDPGHGALWLALVPQPTTSGDFDWTVPFEPWPEGSVVDWAFLMDGTATVVLCSSPPLSVNDCVLTSSPAATIREATFILDADFAVATYASTWGRIKGLYR